MLTFAFLNAVHAEGSNRCSEGVTSDANTSQLHFEGGACFTTYLPEAGLLTLEANVPSTAPVKPRLQFLGRSCQGQKVTTPTFQYLELLPNRVLIDIRHAGDYQFCVTAQDPALEIDEYRISNGFSAAGHHKTDPDEHEPEPDPFTYNPECSTGRYKTDPDEHEPEPDPFTYNPECSTGRYKTDPDEHEPEPDPLVYVPCQLPELRTSLEAICDQNRMDDHSDTFQCATTASLGQEILAEVQNGSGDDEDLFSFLVRDLTSVRIESLGDTNTLGSLYDHNGYRLETDGDGGREANFRIVRSLTPGRYFVRVEGASTSEGPYRLLLEDLSLKE